MPVAYALFRLVEKPGAGGTQITKWQYGTNNFEDANANGLRMKAFDVSELPASAAWDDSEFA